MSPLPNCCYERDPGDWSRYCLEPPDHNGPHGHQWTEVRDGIRRAVATTWQPTAPVDNSSP